MTPRARMLLDMDRDTLFAFVNGRIREGRDPALEPLVIHLRELRSNATIPPGRHAELMARRRPRLHLATFVRVSRRVDLERERWAAARKLIGSWNEPRALTPTSAGDLAALIDSWRSSTDVPGDVRHLDDVCKSAHNMQPHPLSAAPEGTAAR